MPRIAGSLRALLANLIDYAGLYPPAALPLPIVMERYRSFLASPDSWILNRLVLPAAKLPDVALEETFRVTLLVDGEPGPLPESVETLETKTGVKLSLPTYCETPISEIAGGAFAKFRTGGVTADAIPTAETVADFLLDAARRRLPFKTTAGLHHPVRSARALTYAADSPRAAMHGFLNVFTAAAFAWRGAERAAIVDLLNESDADAFHFLSDALTWRSERISLAEIEDSRLHFAHSFGSCSFEEPVNELRALNLLP